MEGCVVRFEAPGEREAAERAWEVVRAAYAEREPVTWPRRHVRPLVAAAVLAAAAAAALSPPGRSVVHSLRKAVGLKQAEPTLFSLPTQGQLLVTSRGGTWIVRPDGSKRLLGHYRDATFSPHGLFVAVTRGNELFAVNPKGHVRWTLARPGPRFPAWTGTRTDTRIAYLSGGRLRIVAGDGTGDHAVGPASLVAPAWRRGPERVLAYATGRSAVVYDADRVRLLFRTPALPERVRKLSWSADGKLLLVFTPHATLVYRGRKLVNRESLSGVSFDLDAAFVGRTHVVAAVRAAGGGSSVVSLTGRRTFFHGTGVFRQLTWSPDGRWLLVTWPTANQWVFVRTERPRRIVGASRISAQFGGFPRVEGWCCAR
jgi:hypothetical protein